MPSDRRVFIDSLHAEGGKGTLGQAPRRLPFFGDMPAPADVESVDG